MRSDPPRPPGLFHRSYRSRLDAFDSLVRAWTAWADEAGVAPQAQRDVVLILDELFSNIVIHGYQHAPTGEIRVEAAVEDEQVHVTLTDHAPLFNPLQVPEPDTTLSLEARPIGGLGLLFVRRTADELRYSLAAVLYSRGFSLVPDILAAAVISQHFAFGGLHASACAQSSWRPSLVATCWAAEICWASRPSRSCRG